MSRQVGTFQVLLFALASLLSIGAANTQQADSATGDATPTDLQGDESLSEAGLAEFYEERLKSAPPEIKNTLAQLQARRTAESLTFTIGYTTALDRPLSELTGANPGRSPEALKEQIARSQAALALYRQLRSSEKRRAPSVPECNPSSNSFSWLSAGKVTPIRQQGCGDCWAFAAMGAFESNYLIENNSTADGAEQELLDCSNGTCNGGHIEDAFDHMESDGTTTEGIRRYKGRKGQCPQNISRPYQLVTWIPLDPDWKRVLSPSEIKKALCEFGPVTASIVPTPTFQAYTGGVYSQVETADIHSKRHYVVITGWNESKRAWEVKNSWGTGWGIRGYAWVKYGANMIGHNVIAVQAAQDNFSREALASIRRQAAPAPKN
jgi:cathepsin L